MRALTWQGKRDVRVDNVPDPQIEQANDAIIPVTSTGLRGSDLRRIAVRLHEAVRRGAGRTGRVPADPTGSIWSDQRSRGAARRSTSPRPTISLSGVYGGTADPLNMLQIFDKQLTLKMGQANVRRWVDEIVPLLNDEDVLGVESFATHHVPLAEAPDAYETFQKKEDGAFKVVFRP